MYFVSFFLYKLHVRTRLIKRGKSVHYSSDGLNVTMPCLDMQHAALQDVYARFYIAVSNFVFPLIANAALIISIMTDPSVTTGASLMLVNNYVTIMGIMCAT
ncbi:hypothetical protein F5141DRAFT_241174 [Pisolithus sp. B1]|nr:hypothetical protein F5141DRAFT_241174 [Pisolithus sp. B1]